MTLNPSQKTFALEWYKLFFPVFVRKEAVSVCENDAFTCGKTTTYFCHAPDGFQGAANSLSSLLRSEPINLLVADSNYGVGRADWDKEAWGAKEFEDAIQFVKIYNRSLDVARFCFFVTDNQLEVLLPLLSNHSLNYRLHTWVKPLEGQGLGQRFRQVTEHFVIAWTGKENDLVKSYDRDDPERYSTAHLQGRLRRFFRTPKGLILNPYQKPIKLMQKIIKETCPVTLKNSLIVDITSGTGTTAVSVPFFSDVQHLTKPEFNRFHFLCHV